MDAFLSRAGQAVRPGAPGRGPWPRLGLESGRGMPAGKAPMGSGTASKKVRPRVPLRPGEGGKDHVIAVSVQPDAAPCAPPLLSVPASKKVRPRVPLRPGEGGKDHVIAVSVHPDAAQGTAFRADWDRWNPGIPLETLDSPHRSLVHPVVDYVRQAQQGGLQVAVLIPEIQPRRWRYRR